MGRKPRPPIRGGDREPGDIKFNPFGFKLPRKIKTRYTPWLVVRSFNGDTGGRPASGVSVFWESPDVGTSGPQGVNQPVAGQPNTVFARVSNFGLQHATGVRVDWSWIDPALAALTPNPIGSAFVNIPSGWSVVVQCPTPWIPVMLNNGHECLFAQAYIPVFDPLTSTPFYPWADRHVGQKNLHLEVLAAGKSFSTKLKAANNAKVARALTLEVRPVLQRTLPVPLANHAAAKKLVLKPPVAAMPVSLRLEGERKAVTGAKITHTVRFKANEIRIADISAQIPSTAKKGDTFMFRAVQRTGTKIDGGYTVCVIVQ